MWEIPTAGIWRQNIFLLVKIFGLEWFLNTLPEVTSQPNKIKVMMSFCGGIIEKAEIIKNDINYPSFLYYFLSLMKEILNSNM